MGERTVQIHAPSINQCQGLCGTCNGMQTVPTNLNALTSFIQGFAVSAELAIQPQLQCGSAPAAMNSIGSRSSLGGVTPLLSVQNQFQNPPSQGSLDRYPYPAYAPPSLVDILYSPQFDSQQSLNQVFQQCSDGDQTRLAYDPIFNSFVEDCIYDKSYGPGYETSAAASLKAFVLWTDSLHRMNRVVNALQQNPLLNVCAACIPVQWTDPVNTAAVLTPVNTYRINANFPYDVRYNGQNQYALDQIIRQMEGPNFMNGQWNSNIMLPSVSQLSLTQLPQQLLTTPITISGDSSEVNPMNQNGLKYEHERISNDEQWIQ
jgi:hypothetical protein